jgi:hypothetical protein
MVNVLGYLAWPYRHSQVENRVSCFFGTEIVRIRHRMTRAVVAAITLGSDQRQWVRSRHRCTARCSQCRPPLDTSPGRHIASRLYHDKRIFKCDAMHALGPVYILHPSHLDTMTYRIGGAGLDGFAKRTSDAGFGAGSHTDGDRRFDSGAVRLRQGGPGSRSKYPTHFRGPQLPRSRSGLAPPLGPPRPPRLVLQGAAG